MLRNTEGVVPDNGSTAARLRHAHKSREADALVAGLASSSKEPTATTAEADSPGAV